MELAVVTSVSAIGHGMFLKGIYDAYDGLKSFLEHPYLATILESLDFETQLQVIETLLREIEEKNQCTDGQVPNASMTVALQAMHETVQKIISTLSQLQKESQIHKTRWFANWRLYYFDPYIGKLQTLKHILKERLHLLVSTHRLV